MDRDLKYFVLTVGDPAAAGAARRWLCCGVRAYTSRWWTSTRQSTSSGHIVGPAAYAALALELDHASDPGVGEAAVHWAITHAPAEVRQVLLQMSARQAGKSTANTTCGSPLWHSARHWMVDRLMI